MGTRNSTIPGVSPRPTGKPAADLTIESVLSASRGNRPVLIGERWRMRAARYPDDRSDECLLIETYQGGQWTVRAVLQPDGVWASA